MRKSRTTGEQSWADGNASTSQKLKLSDSSGDWTEATAEGVTSVVGGIVSRQLKSEKDAANGYAGLNAWGAIDGSRIPYGGTADTACEGNDARLEQQSASDILDDSGVDEGTVDAALDFLYGEIDTNYSMIEDVDAAYSRRGAVIGIADCTLPPPTQNTGDKYILDFTVGTIHPDWDSVSKGGIAEYVGWAWMESYASKVGWVAYSTSDGLDYVLEDSGGLSWNARPKYAEHHADLTDVTANQHHDQVHDLDGSDHNGVSGAVENNFVSFDSNGRPKDSGKDDDDYCQDKFSEIAFLHVRDMVAGGNAPTALSDLVGSTGTGAVQLRKFGSDTVSPLRSLIADWQVPSDIVAGDGVKFSVIGYITETTVPASGEGVSFLLRGGSVGRGDSLNVTLGTAVKSAVTDLDAVGCDTEKDRLVTVQSGSVTVTNLAAGETAMLRLERDTGDADDDYGQSVGVVGVSIEYNRSPVGVA